MKAHLGRPLISFWLNFIFLHWLITWHTAQANENTSNDNLWYVSWSSGIKKYFSGYITKIEWLRLGNMRSSSATLKLLILTINLLVNRILLELMDHRRVQSVKVVNSSTDMGTSWDSYSNVVRLYSISSITSAGMSQSFSENTLPTSSLCKLAVLQTLSEKKYF